jgi:hypothetical protein
MPDFAAGYKFVKTAVENIIKPPPPPVKKEPKTLLETERKQGAGFGQAVIE